MAKTTQIMLTTCATSKNNQGKAMGLANASGGGDVESDKTKGRRGDSGGEGSTRDAAHLSNQQGVKVRMLRNFSKIGVSFSKNLLEVDIIEKKSASNII